MKMAIKLPMKIVFCSFTVYMCICEFENWEEIGKDLKKNVCATSTALQHKALHYPRNYIVMLLHKNTKHRRGSHPNFHNPGESFKKTKNSWELPTKKPVRVSERTIKSLFTLVQLFIAIWWKRIGAKTNGILTTECAFINALPQREIERKWSLNELPHGWMCQWTTS